MTTAEQTLFRKLSLILVGNVRRVVELTFATSWASDDEAYRQIALMCTGNIEHAADIAFTTQP